MGKCQFDSRDGNVECFCAECRSDFREEEMLRFREIVRANAKYYKNLYGKQYYQQNAVEIREKNRIRAKEYYAEKKKLKENK